MRSDEGVDIFNTDGGIPENNSCDGGKPRLVLMGLRRSGKSSIAKVVFSKLAPNETLYLASTNQVVKDDVISFINFQIWDLPGHYDVSNPVMDSKYVFSGALAIVFVVDSQDDYLEALTQLHSTIVFAYRINPHIRFEVFIHKVDGLSEEHRLEIQREIHQHIFDELEEVGIQNMHLSFYLTSIYDYSIFEAFSKVIQKLIPELGAMENLLNILCANCGMEKAFLFDIVSKIYIATDSSPVDIQSYEICSDMIDVIIDLTSIYGSNPKMSIENTLVDENSPLTYTLIKLSNTLGLYYKEITSYTALLCLVRLESFDKQGLIDYNVQCFQDAIIEVFNVKKQTEHDFVRKSFSIAPSSPSC